jgi:hypothetical protein
MLTQIYGNDPHQVISGTSSLSVEDSSNLDLESTLQFTSPTGSAYFDFSVYVQVDADGGNLGEEKQKIHDEIAAFSTLRELVERQYVQFVDHAEKALGVLR